jgi:hypothetical protein
MVIFHIQRETIINSLLLGISGFEINQFLTRNIHQKVFQFNLKDALSCFVSLLDFLLYKHYNLVNSERTSLKDFEFIISIKIKKIT